VLLAAQPGFTLPSMASARKTACGDDAGAKQIVEQLVRDIGAHPIDARPLIAAPGRAH
jgi:predicted dinucleotide-binding enzyme